MPWRTGSCRRSDTILKANAVDLERAKERRQTEAFIDRLTLNADRIKAMARGLEDIASLPDPVGQVMAQWDRPNGLQISRVRVPLGVIGIIYESRPNVTADAGALCLKSGNAVILRGGSDGFESSSAIVSCLEAGLSRCRPAQNRHSNGADHRQGCGRHDVERSGQAPSI